MIRHFRLIMKSAILLLLLSKTVYSQFSNANEPCISDSDCFADWEYCNLTVHVSSSHEHLLAKTKEDDNNTQDHIKEGVC